MLKNAVFFLIALFLFFPETPVSAEDSGAAIYNFEGKASLRRDNTVYQLDYDMPCKLNDILRSDKDGFIDITMKLFAAARLTGATECRIEEVQTNNRHLKLNYGTLLVNLKPLPPDGSFAIETPIVIASVNSAQFTPKPKNNLFLVQHFKPKEGIPYTVAITRAGNLSVFVKESHTTVTMLEEQVLEIKEGSFAPTARNATEEDLVPLEKANSIYITED